MIKKSLEGKSHQLFVITPKVAMFQSQRRDSEVSYKKISSIQSQQILSNHDSENKVRPLTSYETSNSQAAKKNLNYQNLSRAKSRTGEDRPRLHKQANVGFIDRYINLNQDYEGNSLIHVNQKKLVTLKTTVMAFNKQELTPTFTKRNNTPSNWSKVSVKQHDQAQIEVDAEGQSAEIGNYAQRQKVVLFKFKKQYFDKMQVRKIPSNVRSERLNTDITSPRLIPLIRTTSPRGVGKKNSEAYIAKINREVKWYYLIQKHHCSDKEQYANNVLSSKKRLKLHVNIPQSQRKISQQFSQMDSEDRMQQNQRTIGEESSIKLQPIILDNKRSQTRLKTARQPTNLLMVHQESIEKLNNIMQGEGDQYQPVPLKIQHVDITSILQHQQPQNKVRKISVPACYRIQKIRSKVKSYV